MKSALSFVIVLVISLSLCACDPGTNRMSYDDLSENVVHVELIDYDNPDQKHFSSWVPDHSSELQNYDIKKESVKQSLNEHEISYFLTQLSKADILDKYYAYDSPSGICLKLTYDSGDFMILHCNNEEESYSGYVGEFYANGEVKQFVGSFSSYYDFEALVYDFFHYKLGSSQEK